MSGEALSDMELATLFEAGRWAPSSSNEQPWRFVYAKQGTRYWQEFFDLLAEGNKAWCKNAAVLIITLSKKTWDDDGSLNATHSFDTGAAWQNLALQGAALDLVVHGMAGFDYDKARQLLQLPEAYAVEMMIAVGKPGRTEDLPEKYRARETPNERKATKEFVFEGRLPLQLLQKNVGL